MTLNIKSRFHTYDVVSKPNLRSCLEAEHKNCFYLVDKNVYELYKDDFAEIERAKTILIEANEGNKSFGALEVIYDQLIAAGLKKNGELIVVGGGILQDIGGFVATTLYRGIKWQLVPTTFLTQTDSCIGSKSSINLGRGKNLLGTFYPPMQVHLTTEVLKTLESKDLKSGMCEAVKLAMLAGPGEFDWMRSRIFEALSLRDVDEFLFRVLKIKKRYIEEDELDKGVRNLLNFGHTFGHSFERGTDYEIPHGIAVGVGMLAADFFSVELGFANKTHFETSREVLAPLISDYYGIVMNRDATKYVDFMRADKKNMDNNITFILGRNYGDYAKTTLDSSTATRLLKAFFFQLKSGLN